MALRAVKNPSSRPIRCLFTTLFAMPRASRTLSLTSLLPCMLALVSDATYSSTMRRRGVVVANRREKDV
jgi:hypothetical protein